MAPMVSINQNDYGQMIFVPKSPKVVEKAVLGTILGHFPLF